jgi:hypothetical protein
MGGREAPLTWPLRILGWRGCLASRLPDPGRYLV